MTEQKSYRSLAWIAALALFMQALDATILNTALPSISQDLHESPLQMQMAIISYALTVALFIPISGWLADKYGTRNIFRIAVGIFVLGSTLCASANTLLMLIIARIIQGFGGSLMMPVARLAIIRTIPKTQLLPVWNLMAMTGLLGPILGPILGGWLVTHATWHWIFLINIPIGILGIVWAGYVMPNVKGERRKFDWLGFGLFGSGLVGITLGLDLISESLISKSTAGLIMLLGISLIGIYCFYAKDRNNALVPLSLFRIPTFRLGIVGNIFVRLSASGIPFLLPLMLQVVSHYSAESAGWMIAPIALSSVLAKPLSSRLLACLGYKKVLVFTAMFLTLTVASLACLNQHSPLWQHILLVSLYGGCISIMFTAVNTLTICDLDDQYASAGSTILSVTQQVGIGLGIAVSAVILNGYRHLLGDTGEQLQQAFSATFLTSAIFGIILVIVLSQLPRNAGANLQKK